MILGLVFGVMYSCSIIQSPNQTKYIKGTTIVKEIDKLIYLHKTDTITKEGTFDLEKFNPLFNERTKLQEEQNKKMMSNIASMKVFIDSLVKINYNLLLQNNQLGYNQIMSRQEKLSDREKLLIEKENAVKAKKALDDIHTLDTLKEKYTSLILLIGVIANLLATGLLYVYKIKQIKKYQLKYA